MREIIENIVKDLRNNSGNNRGISEEDIYKKYVEKYEMFNKDQKSFKNFTILKCLRNLQLSNEQIMGDLNAIINEKNIYDKTTAIINIYKNKKDSYKGNSNDNNLNNENDEDYLGEEQLNL